MTFRETLPLVLITIILTSFACEQKEADLSFQEFQGYSLLGDSLKIPVRSDQAINSLTAKLSEAQENFDLEQSEINYIWLGRRYGYISDYNKAISIFSEGINAFPDSYKLYRHRGHRFISLRKFDKAIQDFKIAYELMPKDTIEIEPDGAPNKMNIPLSSTQFNILYHYALAHYLKGEFDMAEQIYTECYSKYSGNNDLFVASADWLYMTLRRLNKVEAAQSLLDNVPSDLELIENDSYYKRLLMYKGLIPVEELLSSNEEDQALSLATQGYGLGNWYLYNGDTIKAHQTFKNVIEGTSWAAFGYIASESALKRMQ